MAGTVSIGAGVQWSASSWLFDWVLNDIAKNTDDAELAGHLTEVVDEHLGWFGMDDITPRQRADVRRIATERLVGDALREFPADLQRRPEILAHLENLAATFSAVSAS
jgi:hypothetical protein